MARTSRKLRLCDWCGELIDIGDHYLPYRRRNCGDGCGKVRCHPECIQAICRTSQEEGCCLDWQAGENERGKSWGEEM